jgi:serine/threonine protein kinase
MFGYCMNQLSDGQNLMIITEYMSRGCLTNLLENEPNLSFRKRLDIACGIASGMVRIHEVFIITIIIIIIIIKF